MLKGLPPDELADFMAFVDDVVAHVGSIYPIQLLFDNPPPFNRKAILEALGQTTLGTVEVVESTMTELEVILTDFIEPDAEPPHLVVSLPKAPVDRTQFAQGKQWQHWLLPDFERVLPTLTHSLYLTDAMSDHLYAEERVRLLAEGLAAVLKTVDCRALYFQPTDLLIEPDEFLAAMGDPQMQIFPPGFLNTRLIGLNRADEFMVDTLGLDVLGLPDVQCSCRGLDAQEVVQFIFGAGAHVFGQAGDIIEGDSIEGPDGSSWVFKIDESHAPPLREVFTLVPPRAHRAKSPELRRPKR